MSEIHKKVVPLQAQTDHDTHDDHLHESFDSSATVVGEAVGVPEKHWYIALVGQNTEKVCRERLQKMGYECFVATQSELRQWKNGRRSTIERVVITGIVFVNITEQERVEIVTLPYIKRFLTDKSRQSSHGVHSLAIVSHQEMERLRFMLYQTDYPVFFDSRQLQKGSLIRVVRGAMKGFEGCVTRLPGSGSFVVASLGILGNALVQIPMEDVQIITK